MNIFFLRSVSTNSIGKSITTLRLLRKPSNTSATHYESIGDLVFTDYLNDGNFTNPYVNVEVESNYLNLLSMGKVLKTIKDKFYCDEQEVEKVILELGLKECKIFENEIVPLRYEGYLLVSAIRMEDKQLMRKHIVSSESFLEGIFRREYENDYSKYDLLHKRITF